MTPKTLRQLQKLLAAAASLADTIDESSDTIDECREFDLDGNPLTGTVKVKAAAALAALAQAEAALGVLGTAVIERIEAETKAPEAFDLSAVAGA